MTESPAAPDSVAKLVPTKSDKDVAIDLKARLEQALVPVLELMDEAMRQGLLVRWDAMAPQPPLLRHKLIGLRLEKHF